MDTEPAPLKGPKIIELTACTVDLVQQVVITDGEAIQLAGHEIQLLRYLGARPNQVIPREEIFTEVWGYDPNTLIRAVDHTIKALRSKIEADSANPQHLFGLVGQGYRFEPLTAVEDSTPSVLSTNIASQSMPILGREEDLRTLSNLLHSGTRLVTLLGAGGLGKTRLAQEIARVAATESTFAGGTWFCDLVECRSFRDILHTVSDVLSIRLESTDDPIGSAHALGRAIATRGEMFIVLDNFEQVANFAPQTLGIWQQLAESTQFLVTSRQALALPNEQIYPIKALSPEAGLALFIQRATAVLPDLRLRAEDHSNMAQIVTQLESIPLAILLAAGRIASMSPVQILTHLEERFHLLRQGPRISENRQEIMQTAIDWSWELLDDTERSVLRQCAVFRSGFTLEAAETVIAIDPLGSESRPIETVLQDLADKSMLYVQGTPEKALDYRICAFDNIRYYALEKFEADDALASARKRHAEYFQYWSKRQVNGLNHDMAFRCLYRLRYEIDNLVAALETTVEHDPSRAMPLAEAIERVYFSNGWLQGNVEILETLLPVASTLSLDDQCSLYHLLGRNHQAQGHHSAEQDAKRALLALLQNDPKHPKNTSILQSQVNELRREGKHIEASDLLQAWIDERPDLPPGELCGIHAKLGLIQYMQQDMTAAADNLQRAIALGKGTVDQSWRASIMANLGSIYVGLGEVKLGKQHLQQALEQHERFGNRASVAIALANLAQADLRLGEPQHAAVKLQRAVALLRDTRRVSVIVNVMLVLVTAHMIAGEEGAATEMLKQAQQTSRDDALYLALTQSFEAALAAADGDADTATTLWSESAPTIVPAAMLSETQWQSLGKAHLDLKKAAKLIKHPDFLVPRHPHECPTKGNSGREHHHLHILLLEHRVATQG